MMTVNELVELSKDEAQYQKFIRDESRRLVDASKPQEIINVIFSLKLLYDSALSGRYAVWEDKTFKSILDEQISDTKYCRIKKHFDPAKTRKVYDLCEKIYNDVIDSCDELHEEDVNVFSFFKDFKLDAEKDDECTTWECVFDVVVAALDSDMILIRINEAYREEYPLILHEAIKMLKKV